MADDHKLDPALQRAVDEATARKTIAEASSAQLTAETARLKTAIGDPLAGPYKGSVDAEQGAASAEMNWLARSQLAELAGSVATAIVIAAGDRGMFYITSADAPPDLGHDTALTERIDLVTAAKDGAIKVSDSALEAGAAPAAHAAAAAHASFAGLLLPAGLVLSAASSLLGYFRTDYKLGGGALTIADRSLILLLAAKLKKPDIPVYTEANLPQPSDEIRAAVKAQLLDLSTAIADLRERVALHTEKITELTIRIETPLPAGGPKPNSAKVIGERRRHQEALAACDSAIALHDALLTMLYADAGGTPFIERALRERMLRSKLGAKAVIVSAKIDGAWGSTISWQNLGSSFGKLPMKASATVGVSWGAFDFVSGDLLGADVQTQRSDLVDVWTIKGGALG